MRHHYTEFALKRVGASLIDYATSDIIYGLECTFFRRSLQPCSTLAKHTLYVCKSVSNFTPFLVDLRAN